MVPAGGARSLARVVEPYFERSHDRFSGHSYTPPGRLSRYSAIVLNRLEAGGALLTASAPLFAAYGRHAVPEHRRLIGNCLALLLPRPLVRAPEAPSVLETTVMKKGAATIVHLLSFVRERRGDLDIVEDALPLLDLPISIRTDRRPKHVELVPHRARHPARRPRHAGVPMITMRSDWWNADSYYPWIDPLVEAAFGAEIDLHWDLYLQTHAHRLQHGPGCEAYPSPPSRAPLWAILAGTDPEPARDNPGDRHRHRLLDGSDRRGVPALTAVHRRTRRPAPPDRRTDVRGRRRRRPDHHRAVDGGGADRALRPCVRRWTRRGARSPAQGLPVHRRRRETDLPQRRDRCPAAAARPDRRHRRVPLRFARQRYRDASADLLREARHSGRGPSR